MMQLEGFQASHACELARVSRAGFYRHYAEHEPRQADVELRDLIQRVVLENRFYGYRRVTAELRNQGVAVNHKRVLRLMRQDNLLAVRKRRFAFTTDSQHSFAVYPNLAARLALGGLNQLWVADITYVRLRETFLYLAVILDAYSRRVIGWALGEDLRAELALTALARALVRRPVQPGIVHHSDRGVQYCSEAYVQRLHSFGFLISMSRRGNPYDNARAESFMKTLKLEEVHLRRYRNLGDARDSVGHFIDDVYNAKRLHSSLGYLAPAVFEELTTSGGVSMLHPATESRGAALPPLRDLIVSMSFQPVIPQWVALQQSPPLLRQPEALWITSELLPTVCQQMVTYPYFLYLTVRVQSSQ
jgi:transposase InsO family protein